MTESAKQSLPLGSSLNQFEIRSVLGAGGFGVTYKAWDTELRREVAIKEFLPVDMAVRDNATTVIAARESRENDYHLGLERFLEEARTLALFDHPNIISVHSFFKANGSAYMVMPYVEGETLTERLEHGGCPSEVALKALFVPLLQGLVKIHREGFLHRDIKPGNIYLTRSGEPLLIDFGAAREAIGQQSRSITGIVSAGYAPPEQYTTDPRKQGPWTDLYALGATMYRCISGAEPVDSMTRREAVLDGENDPLNLDLLQFRGQYSPTLLSLIGDLLVPSFRQRPQTAQAVLEALQRGQTYSGEFHVSAEQSGTPATRMVAEQDKGFAALAQQEQQEQQAQQAPPPPSTLPTAVAPRSTAATAAAALASTALPPPTVETAQRARFGKPLGVALGALALVAAGIAAWLATPGSVSGPLSREALLAGRGVVDIRSEPSGATVTLDGVAIGETPLHAGTVRAGQYRLRLVHLNGSDYEGELVVVNDRVVKQQHTLVPAQGQLTVLSEPAGAWVVLNGQRQQERTPATLDQLAAGEHHLVVGKLGYRSQEHTVVITDDQLTRQRFELDAGPVGRLKIATVPSHARIILPDIVPRYAENMELPPGHHRVIVKAPGYRTWTGSVRLVEGELASEAVQLTPQLTRAAEPAEAEGVEQVAETTDAKEEPKGNVFKAMGRGLRDSFKGAAGHTRRMFDED